MHDGSVNAVCQSDIFIIHHLRYPLTHTMFVKYAYNILLYLNKNVDI